MQGSTGDGSTAQGEHGGARTGRASPATVHARRDARAGARVTYAGARCGGEVREEHLGREGGDLRVGDALAASVDGVADGEGARRVGDPDDVTRVCLLDGGARVGEQRLREERRGGKLGRATAMGGKAGAAVGCGGRGPEGASARLHARERELLALEACVFDLHATLEAARADAHVREAVAVLGVEVGLRREMQRRCSGSWCGGAVEMVRRCSGVAVKAAQMEGDGGGPVA